MSSSAAPLESLVVSKAEDKSNVIDREQTCPLLLRAFCTYGRHAAKDDYYKGIYPASELQIYTWMDATLREIATLIKEVNTDVAEKGSIFDFLLIGLDRKTQRIYTRNLGTVVNGQRGPDDDKTLGILKFEIGDFLDVCLTPPSKATYLDPIRRGRFREERNPLLRMRGDRY